MIMPYMDSAVSDESIESHVISAVPCQVPQNVSDEEDNTVQIIADNNLEYIQNSQFVGTPSASAANENQNMQIGCKLTPGKNLEKNTFRTSDSSDFGSHSPHNAAAVQQAEHFIPLNDSKKDEGSTEIIAAESQQ